jgi:DNA-binding MarR family transcriptional regulator
MSRGLSRNQLAILALAGVRERLSCSVVAKALGIHRASASRALYSLWDRGLLDAWEGGLARPGNGRWFTLAKGKTK